MSDLRREMGLIVVDDKAMRVVDRVEMGDIIHLTHKTEISTKTEILDIDINILFEDDHLAVVEKPAGIAVLPTKNHYTKSLKNALAKQWGEFVYRPVNRLDRDTSGLMIVAKSTLAHSKLVKGGIKISRHYLALLGGETSDLQDSGTIDANIDRLSDESMKRVVRETGQTAISHFAILARFDTFALAEFVLETGRTHQIRVHAEHIGHPLLGDKLYGGNLDKITRQALHSHSVQFTHPITGEMMQYECPLPDDMQSLLDTNQVCHR